MVTTLVDGDGEVSASIHGFFERPQPSLGALSPACCSQLEQLGLQTQLHLDEPCPELLLLTDLTAVCRKWPRG